MPEVQDNRGVLAPEDCAQDCGPWLLWVEPTGVHSSAPQFQLDGICLVDPRPEAAMARV